MRDVVLQQILSNPLPIRISVSQVKRWTKTRSRTSSHRSKTSSRRTAARRQKISQHILLSRSEGWPSEAWASSTRQGSPDITLCGRKGRTTKGTSRRTWMHSSTSIAERSLVSSPRTFPSRTGSASRTQWSQSCTLTDIRRRKSSPQKSISLSLETSCTSIPIRQSRDSWTIQSLLSFFIISSFRVAPSFSKVQLKIRLHNTHLSWKRTCEHSTRMLWTL